MEKLNLSQLTYTTRCKLFSAKKGSNGSAPVPSPCGFNVTDSPMNVEIIGQPDARAQRFIGVLMKHLNEKHPEAAQVLNSTVAHFAGWLAITAFDTPDPRFADAKQKVEYGLRRMVCGPEVSDSDIETVLGRLEFSQDDPHLKGVQFELQNLRDYYEGKLPDQQTANRPSPLVKP